MTYICLEELVIYNLYKNSCIRKIQIKYREYIKYKNEKLLKKKEQEIINLKSELFIKNKCIADCKYKIKCQKKVIKHMNLNKTIQNINLSEVKADLNDVSNLDLKSNVEKILKQLQIENQSIHKEFSHGTLIKISDLNDDWDDDSVARIYQDLELLTPPNEQNIYKIFCFSSLNPENYGEVISSVHEDYDYKLIANVNKNKKVSL
jgi:hypothetical protein